MRASQVWSEPRDSCMTLLETMLTLAVMSIVMTLAFFRMRSAGRVAAVAGGVPCACGELPAAIVAAMPAPAVIRKPRRGIDPVPMAASH